MYDKEMKRPIWYDFDESYQIKRFNTLRKYVYLFWLPFIATKDQIRYPKAGYNIICYE